MMYVREFRSSMGGKLGAIVAGTALLVLVGVFLAFGFVLLIGLAVAGLILGIGGALLRRLTGRPRVRRPGVRILAEGDGLRLPLVAFERLEAVCRGNA